MRLIDANALKKALKSNCDTLCNDKNTNWCEHCCPLNDFEDLIDNAPTVDVKFELKTENGITYPKALEHMTFTHTLSIEERQNIIEAYMLGANSNVRPRGEWINIGFMVCKCSNCGQQFHELEENNFCPYCGCEVK